MEKPSIVFVLQEMKFGKWTDISGDYSEPKNVFGSVEMLYLKEFLAGSVRVVRRTYIMSQVVVTLKDNIFPKYD